MELHGPSDNQMSGSDAPITRDFIPVRSVIESYNHVSLAEIEGNHHLAEAI